nr:Preprotein translocase SecG subunit [Calliblepharis sp.]
MRLIWYLVSIITICLILINNPKANNLGNFGQQLSVFNFTRNTQQGLNWIITFNVVVFFIFTVCSVLLLYI